MRIQSYQELKSLAIGSMLGEETDEERSRLVNCENEKMAKGIAIRGKSEQNE